MQIMYVMLCFIRNALPSLKPFVVSIFAWRHLPTHILYLAGDCIKYQSDDKEYRVVRSSRGMLLDFICVNITSKMVYDHEQQIHY